MASSSRSATPAASGRPSSGTTADAGRRSCGGWPPTSAANRHRRAPWYDSASPREKPSNMSDPRPLMQTEGENGRIVVRLSGEIDLSNVDGLEAQIDNAIADAGDIVIDLTAIDFIDSRGLRLLKRVSGSVA